MEIRKAIKKDIPQLSELFRLEIEFHQTLACYYELQAGFDWLNYAEEKFNRSNGLIFVAESTGGLAGFVDIRITKYPPDNRYKSTLQRIRYGSKKIKTFPVKSLRWGIIEECYVDPSFRRRGIGSRLVYSALEWFQSKQINRIELSLIAKNKEGETFWKKFGFVTFRISLAREINNQIVEE